MVIVRLEFTVEPFHDGAPGPHVRAAIDAVAALGLVVDVGPFGSTAEAEEPLAVAAAGALLAAAFAAGASRVSLQMTRFDGGPA